MSRAQRVAQAKQGQSACDPCDEGTDQQQAGQAACVPCASGSVANTTGLDRCFTCPRGFSASQGLQCVECAEGFASDVAGLSNCNPCPVGQFNNVSGSTSCLRCAKGTAATDIGASLCSDCSPGFFSGAVHVVRRLAHASQGKPPPSACRVLLAPVPRTRGPPLACSAPRVVPKDKAARCAGQHQHTTSL